MQITTEKVTIVFRGSKYEAELQEEAGRYPKTYHLIILSSWGEKGGFQEGSPVRNEFSGKYFTIEGRGKYWQFLTGGEVRQVNGDYLA